MATKKTAAKKTGPADIRTVLVDFAGGGYVPTRFGDVVCGCGVRELHLLLDDDAGVAIRACPVCEEEQPLGDSEEFIDDDTEPGMCACPCGGEVFCAVVGLALYDDDKAVRWVSIGLRCVQCEKAACYGDWKNEHDDVADYLRRL